MGRAGRVLHWTCLAAAALLLLMTPALAPSTADGVRDYGSAIAIVVPFALVVALAGRGLRYILAGE